MLCAGQQTRLPLVVGRQSELPPQQAIVPGLEPGQAAVVPLGQQYDTFGTLGMETQLPWQQMTEGVPPPDDGSMQTEALVEQQTPPPVGPATHDWPAWQQVTLLKSALRQAAVEPLGQQTCVLMPGTLTQLPSQQTTVGVEVLLGLRQAPVAVSGQQTDAP
jgi:hypothetical protein